MSRKTMFLSQLREEKYHQNVIVPTMGQEAIAQAAELGFFIWSSASVLSHQFDIVLINVDPMRFISERTTSTERIKKVMLWGIDHGYTDVGLGSLTASVSHGGEDLLSLAGSIGLRLDHGDDMSTALAWRQANLVAEYGLELSQSTIAVVGAVGIMGAGFAQLIAGQVKKLVLVVRQEDDRSAGLAKIVGRETQVQMATSLNALLDADVVYTAYSAPDLQVNPDYLKSGAIVLDACIPPAIYPRNFQDSDGKYLLMPTGCGVLPIKIAPRGVGVDLGMGGNQNGPTVYGCMIGCALAMHLGVTEHRLGAVDVCYARKVLSAGDSLGVVPQPAQMFGNYLSDHEISAFMVRRQ